MDKQIIDEERMFECVWCKYGFKESDANFILSENPNECVCSGCITEWADNLLCDLKRKEQECEELKSDLTDLSKIIDCKNGTILTFKQQLDQLKAENEELTSKCSQLEEKLQKYIDKEQWEIELNKKRADSFKEMRKMLYGKFIGNSLIEKRNPYEN